MFDTTGEDINVFAKSKLFYNIIMYCLLLAQKSDSDKVCIRQHKESPFHDRLMAIETESNQIVVFHNLFDLPQGWKDWDTDQVQIIKKVIILYGI